MQQQYVISALQAHKRSGFVSLIIPVTDLSVLWCVSTSWRGQSPRWDNKKWLWLEIWGYHDRPTIVFACTEYCWGKHLGRSCFYTHRNHQCCYGSISGNRIWWSLHCTVPENIQELHVTTHLCLYYDAPIQVFVSILGFARVKWNLKHWESKEQKTEAVKQPRPWPSFTLFVSLRVKAMLWKRLRVTDREIERHKEKGREEKKRGLMQ